MAKIVADIQQSDVARVTTVVLNGAARIAPVATDEDVADVMLSIYYRLDRWLFRRLLKIERDAFEPVDLRPLVGKAEVLEVVPLEQRYTDRFDPTTLERLRAERLDVVLRFGFQSLAVTRNRRRQTGVVVSRWRYLDQSCAPTL